MQYPSYSTIVGEEQSEETKQLREFVQEDEMVYFRPTSIPLSDKTCEHVKKELHEGVSDSYFHKLFEYLRGLE